MRQAASRRCVRSEIYTIIIMAFGYWIKSSLCVRVNGKESANGEGYLLRFSALVLALRKAERGELHTVKGTERLPVNLHVERFRWVDAADVDGGDMLLGLVHKDTLSFAFLLVRYGQDLHPGI